MERLVGMVAVLHDAGRTGLSAERLIAAAGYGGEQVQDSLQNDLRRLRDLGWQIENVADVGEPARYVMTTVDNRLRLRLTPDQTAALQRAAAVADRADLVTRLGLGDLRPEAAEPVRVQLGEPPSALDEVIEAVARRCRIRFEYKAAERRADPQVVRSGKGGWYLEAVEVGDTQVKTFHVGRMSGVELEAPGTAVITGQRARRTLDPMTWEEDPPVDVVVTLDPAFRDDVVALLRRPVAEQRVGDELRLTFRVVNRAALRTRLFELGRRVRVVGPPEVREELLAALRDAAGLPSSPGEAGSAG
jgi:predicted DNA-binding transcriptional regulator YafY